VAGDRTPHPDPEIEELILASAAAAGVTRHDFSDDAILQRCMFALINEGAKILAEGKAYRASDIDVIYTNGYGFPSFRGGPMNYADQVGLETVYQAVKEMFDGGDEWMDPAPLLARLATEGKTFADWDAENN
jgi:3-hydroxyacyl-CoA dehydrogenase